MQKSEMTRWTHATNEAFYLLHKSAMGLYDTCKLLALFVWIIFSTQYLKILILENAPFIADGLALPLAIGLLMFLHYVANDLLRYTSYNVLDNDPNTVNSPSNLVILGLVYVGLFMLDVKGTTSFFDESPKFENMELTKEAEKNRKLTYESDLTTLSNAYALDVQKLRTDSAAAVAKAQAVKCYDQWDRDQRDKKVANKKGEWAATIGTKLSEYATEQRTLLTAKNQDLATLSTKHTTKGTKITTDAEANKSGASHKGWMISLICLLVTVFCTIQGTKLRVKAGQKPISRFTINDATGTVTEKAYDAAQDVWQRWAHAAIDRVHNSLAIESLNELDGAYTLKKRRDDAAPSVSGTPPPPPPTSGAGAPPPSGGSGGGGDDDGKTAPPSVPTPTPGEAVPLFSELSEKAVSDAMRDCGFTFAQLLSTEQYEKVAALAKIYDMRDKRPASKQDASALNAIHEIGHFIVYVHLCNMKGIKPTPIEIRIPENGIINNDCYFRHVANDLSPIEETTISMAGFAAESIAVNCRNPIGTFDTLKNRKVSDIETSKNLCSESEMFTCYINAIDIIKQHEECFGALSSVLVDKKVFTQRELEKFAETFMPPTPSVKEAQKTVITADDGRSTVITAVHLNLIANQEFILAAFRKDIQELNTESRHYETKNGVAQSVVKRIAAKLVDIHKTYEIHKDWIPTSVINNYIDAYNKARNIVAEYTNNTKNQTSLFGDKEGRND
jgi:hypothetical protein